MVVLWTGLVNRENVVLNSNANTSLFSSPHLSKVKRYFSNFFGGCVPVLMLNKKSLLSCFEKGFTLDLMTFSNLLR